MATPTRLATQIQDFSGYPTSYGRACIGRQVAYCWKCGKDHCFNFFADKVAAPLAQRNVRAYTMGTDLCELPDERALVIALRYRFGQVPIVR